MKNRFSISCLKACIVPLIMGKARNTLDKNSYKYIALVTAVLKISEFCIVNIIEFFEEVIISSFLTINISHI